LRIIKIDGIEPTAENLRSKKYKMAYQFYLYRHKDLQSDDIIIALIDQLLKSRKDHFAESGLIMPH
jgi:ABC-type phosphate transport system substrate-binding protein